MQRPKEYSQVEILGDLEDFLEIRHQNDASGNPLFIGYSYKPNASTSSPIWYIVKRTYDGNNGLTRQQLPDDGPKFGYAWDDRAGAFS